jgi:protein-S-isoprenylcysteine O-methyltransferase Ste14
MYQSITFFFVTVVFAYLSRNYFLKPSSHGFFRFFAFESILVLVLINIHAWFRDPFSVQQIFSWLCLFASLFLAIHGFYLLRTIGKPRGKIEDTSFLVTRGAYRYIRHPLYSSLLWLAFGAFLKQPSISGIALLVATLAFLLATAWVEETENLQRFGQDYILYMENTKMFIPFIF